MTFDSAIGVGEQEEAAVNWEDFPNCAYTSFRFISFGYMKFSPNNSYDVDEIATTTKAIGKLNNPEKYVNGKLRKELDNCMEYIRVNLLPSVQAEFYD
jgi:hypothetical protein